MATARKSPTTKATASPPPKKSAARRSPPSTDTTGRGGETHQVAAPGGPVLTTQQGAPVSDDQNTLRVGERGPAAARGLPLPGEDLPLRPRAHPRARRPRPRLRRPRLLRDYESLADLTTADIFQRAGERTPAFVRFSTVAGSKGSFDLARDVRGFAVKLYTQRGQLGPRRQQHPGLLHPGSDQVPRHHPRREARARPRSSRRRSRPTTTSGTSSR